MALPEGTVIFTPDNRDDDGYYMIMPGQSYLFPCRVPFLGTLTITAIHTGTGGQDFSLDTWFSLKPLGQSLYLGRSNLDNFRLGRLVRTFVIWDNLSVNPGDGRAGAPSNVDIYLNIKNQSNSTNTFKLTFSN